jgi:hypothetical protein
MKPYMGSVGGHITTHCRTKSWDIDLSTLVDLSGTIAPRLLGRVDGSSGMCLGGILSSGQDVCLRLFQAVDNA